MYQDHEFDPVTPEQEADHAASVEFKRRVRQEVRRMDRGEAEEDLRADEEQEEAEKAEEQVREQKERRRKANPFRQFITGTILVREGVSRFYGYMLAIAGMFFLSIAVLFWGLHLDMRCSRLEREIQLLRERSIRLQEQRYRMTTHSAIVEELQRRGIELYDPLAPGETIDE